MEQHNTQKLAERIALILQEEDKSLEISSLRHAVENMSERISAIETKLGNSNGNFNNFQKLNLLHPSQEKFLNLEDLADQVLDSINQKEKACPYEPTGKPCDHCAMCSSRGF